MKNLHSVPGSLATAPAVLAALLLAAGCHSAEPPKPAEVTQTRGRVLDQATGLPVPGTIVIAKYRGGVAWGGGSCNRVESAVADQNGEFVLPLDPRLGARYMEAYHRDYGLARPPRYAVGIAPDKWQIWVQ